LNWMVCLRVPVGTLMRARHESAGLLAYGARMVVSTERRHSLKALGWIAGTKGGGLRGTTLVRLKAGLLTTWDG